MNNNPSSPTHIDLIGIWKQNRSGYGGKSIIDTVEFNSNGTWLSYTSTQKTGKYLFDQKYLLWKNSGDTLLESDSIFSIISDNLFYAYTWDGVAQVLIYYERK